MNEEKIEKASFTLLEILISIGIFVLISATVVVVFNQTFKTYKASMVQSRIFEKISLFSNWFFKDLSTARCLCDIRNNSFVFKDSTGNYTGYFINDTTLLRGRSTDSCVSFINNTLLEGLSISNLTYYSFNNTNAQFLLQDNYSYLTHQTPHIRFIELEGQVSSGSKDFYLYTGGGFLPSRDCPYLIQHYLLNLSEGYNTWVYSVKNTLDGGFIYAGSYGLTGSPLYYLLIKSDWFSIPQWTKIYNIQSGYAPGSQRFFSVKSLPEGGYIAGGMAKALSGKYDCVLAKFNSTGYPLWVKAYDLGENEVCYDVQISSQEGYILSGYTDKSGKNEALVIKTDSRGEVGADLFNTWVFRYGDGGINVTEAEAYKVLPLPEGYLVAGKIRLPPVSTGQADFLILKLNPQGEIDWRAGYGDAGVDIAWEASQTPEGSYLILGHGMPSERSYSKEFLLLNLEPTGAFNWAKAYGKDSSLEYCNIEFEPFAASCSDNLIRVEDGYLFSGNVFFSNNQTLVGIVKVDWGGNLTFFKALGGNYSYSYSLTKSREDIVHWAPVDFVDNTVYLFYALSLDENGEIPCCIGNTSYNATETPLSSTYFKDDTSLASYISNFSETSNITSSNLTFNVAEKSTNSLYFCPRFGIPE